MNDYFNDFQASIFALLYQKALNWKASGVLQGFEMFKFDAHATLEEIPKVDVLGPMELSVESDHNLQTAQCLLAISTYDDHNIIRLDRMTGDLYAAMRPDTRIPLVDAITGNRKGSLVVMNGTSIMPILNTDTRAVRTIGVTLGADAVPTP